MPANAAELLRLKDGLKHNPRGPALVNSAAAELLRLKDGLKPASLPHSGLSLPHAAELLRLKDGLKRILEWAGKYQVKRC